MKKRRILAIILVILLAIIGVIMYIILHKGGDVSNVKTSFTSTDYHSEDDIHTSMKIVEAKFKKDFKGCTLTDLWYDDAENDGKQQNSDKNQIVLLSNFDVDASGSELGLNPNSNYKNWQWILVKNNDGKWKLKDWGY